MASLPTPMTVGRRYELTNLLGKGGMGSVYRARDLLSGKWVALKRVTIATEELVFEQSQENANLELALAVEFKALAALRHPHIISVYDFGFDHRHGPYFTMEYIEDGKPVTDAGHAFSFQEKIKLVIQMLHALAYLHRRGILHRDLKPANALIKNGKVKLLDFGLSVNTGHTVQYVTETTVGTLAYIAPEIFGGAPYSRSSDLYALGIIAVELLTDRYPYEDANLAILLNDIINKDVDFTDSELPAELNEILKRMVAKPLENRYGSCLEVISDLSQAVGISVAPQSDELRESFFQAAKFVGRSAELAHLVKAFEEAVQGRGNAVLIEGESGAGKSRLADEIRIRALVDGAVVLEGQAIDRGHSPFQTWQEPLKMLALLADADKNEAAILSGFVPGLAKMLGRMIPKPPPANPTEARQVLSRTIINMIVRLDYPVMVILEDIHWAGSESIQLLDSLASASQKLQCLIIGTYRTDEDHLILDEAKEAERIALGRLTEEEVAKLGASMLGDVGKDQEMIHFLLKESEGNAFFLVEVARAVSEEAGDLNAVEVASLPQSVISGGMASILNRRINRVPEQAQGLLMTASVAGRILDLDLLQAIAPDVDLEQWLSICTEAAVLEPFGETWRFAHDKIREVIRDQLSHEMHHRLHRQVAEAMEELYGDASEIAAPLTHHWAVAGDKLRELHYAEIAACYASGTNASKEAVRLYQRALALLMELPRNDERDKRELNLLMGLGPHIMATKGYTAIEVRDLYTRAKRLASNMDQTDIYFQATWGLWTYNNHIFDRGAEDELLVELFNLAYQANDDGLMLEAHHSGWAAALTRGAAAEVERNVNRGLEIYDSENFRDHIRIFGHDPGVCAHFVGGINLWLLGFPDKAEQRVGKGLVLAEALKHPLSTANIMWGDVVVSSLRGEKSRALNRAEELVTFSQDLGFQMYEKIVRSFQESMLAIDGQHKEELPKLGEILSHALSTGGFILWPWILSLYLEACRLNGHLDAGLQAFHEELARHKMTGQRPFESELRRLYGKLLLAKSKDLTLEAEKEFLLAREIARRQGAKSLELRTVLDLARLWSERGDIAKAEDELGKIYSWFGEGLETADLIEAKAVLDGLQKSQS